MTMQSTSAGKCPFTNASEDFRPFDLKDPFPFYAWARENAPVFFAEKLGYYVVASHEDGKAIFEDWQTFSSEIAQSPVRPFGEEAKRVMREGGFTAYSGLSARIPPEHTRIRRAVQRCFGPKRFQAIEPQIREIVTQALDAMEAKGLADFHAEFAYEVPALVVFRLVGVPAEDVAKVKAWAVSRAMLTWGELSDEEQVPHARAMVEYWRYCRELVKRRHEIATDDLPGDLVRMQQAGENISDDEIAGVLYSVLFAGHETTTNLMSNGLRELLLHPREWERLRADPSLIPNAVDECLRFSPSVIVWRRKALTDAEIRGVKIPKGSNILLLLGSANRDEAVFPDGDTLDIGRPNSNQHLSFGFGIHNCVGRQLARLEFSVALQELVRRFHGLKVVPDQSFEFLPIVSFRVPRALQIEWDPPVGVHAA
jgi:cytochrome P450